MLEAIPPVTVFDNGDIEVYADVSSACSDLEIYDLRQLMIWDGLARRLQPVTSGYLVVDLVLSKDAQPEPEALRARLIKYIRRTGSENFNLADGYLDAPLDVLLSVLLEASQTVSGTSWLRTWMNRFQRMICGD